MNLTSTKSELKKELVKVRNENKDLKAIGNSLQNTTNRQGKEIQQLKRELDKQEFINKNLLSEIDAHRTVLRREQLSDRQIIAIPKEQFTKSYTFATEIGGD